jgi:MATE family multidrug resistance protein
MRHVVETKEVIEIASQLLFVAAFFQISDGIQVVVLGALRGLQDVKIPMYITFVAYWVVGFPISIYLGLYTDLKGWDLDRITGRIIFCRFIFVSSLLSTNKKFVVREICKIMLS